jgi:hypothetical protein
VLKEGGPTNQAGAVVRTGWFQARFRLAGQVDRFRVARHPPRIDAKRGNRFLRADFSVPIRR